MATEFDQFIALVGLGIIAKAIGGNRLKIVAKIADVLHVAGTIMVENNDEQIHYKKNRPIRKTVQTH
ncbi:hypothetical protein [Desulfosarcina ovata]|uniref:hypothetical protein n=1 Tax=Desulfosarcina ovata TaxID=83564 RepID=UPI001566B46B|nr:hypothetical protein [Desulfosarcina ovata]